ncbi:MAG TPA: AfsR/SARP family transcriptional regulator [Nonomuraea sp.]|nr:AfsR/SARP family transcriptional regulator [Nonomuraea sp.]
MRVRKGACRHGASSERRGRRRALERFVGVPLIDDLVARFSELHLTIAEDWAELELERGRCVEVLNRLDDLVPAHPARDRLVAARMTALAGCGRAPEALAQFETVRRHLAAELGIDPSPALRKLYEEILTGNGSAGRRHRPHPGRPP